MTIKQRIKELKSIESDIIERGEKRVSKITFLACIYQTRVEKDGKKKKVNYSSSKEILNSYREIKHQ